MRALFSFRLYRLSTIKNFIDYRLSTIDYADYPGAWGLKNHTPAHHRATAETLQRCTAPTRERCNASTLYRGKVLRYHEIGPGLLCNGFLYTSKWYKKACYSL